MRNVKILGTGLYLPKKEICNKDLEKVVKVDETTLLNKSGVEKRFYVGEGETASKMGAEAVRQALLSSGLSPNDLDLLVCASGTMQMPIPCTASLIHKELGLHATPAFDINSTCLSFVTGLDTLSYLVQAGRYQRVALVSTEVASVGLNHSDLESVSLFGDGAAAAILSSSEDGRSGILSSAMETYSEGWRCCRIEGGGTGLHAMNWSSEESDRFLFQMNGRGVFRLASSYLPAFVKRLLDYCGYTLEDLDLVIPHQASQSAMRIIQKKLGIDPGKFVEIIRERGNVIAASIPMALHEAIQSGRLSRGDRAMLLGTSAGLSLGGLILEY